MIAAQRFKGLGWFVATAGGALGFYVISLQVAAERGKLEAVETAILRAHRDIRSLETEFDTRANLAQLERWNGSVLSLVAPAAGQFIQGEAAFARLDQLGGSARVETAALVVPAGLPTAAPAIASDAVAAATAVPVTAAAVVAAAAAPVASASRTVRGESAVPTVKLAAPVPAAKPAPTPKPQQVAKAEPKAGRSAVAAIMAKMTPKQRGTAVAMLEDKLLSDSTLGELMSRARTESRGGR